MNKSLTTSIVFIAISTISGAADLFDSPGPGYHQQIERAFQKLTKDAPTVIQFGSPIIRVVPSGFPSPELPLPQWPALIPAPVSDPKLALPRPATGAFSEPIRITIDNSVAPSPRSEPNKAK